MFAFVYDLVLFAVIAASGRSGRYERYFAFVLITAQIPFQVATGKLEGVAELVISGALDAYTLAGALWLWRRRRASWLAVEVAIQAAGVVINLLFHWLHTPGVRGDPLVVALFFVAGAMSYLQLIVLVFAVLRREFGPPFRIAHAAA